MRLYKGVITGNTVILEQGPETHEGTEALVLDSHNRRRGTRNRTAEALLAQSFVMGKLYRRW